MDATLVSFADVALLSLLAAFSLAFSVAADSVAPVLSVLISDFVSFAFADSVFFSLACEWKSTVSKQRDFIDNVYYVLSFVFFVVVLIDLYFECISLIENSN